jgi:Fe-S-cluster containining protein
MEFHFAAGASFSCVSCGKCCSSGFEIPVEGEKAARIQSTPLHRELVKEGYQPLAVLAESVHHLSYNQQGRCHYHRDDRCGLHSQYGLDYKPVVCQLYPFIVVDTPAGHFVSLLFSCPSVVSGGGLSLAQQQQDFQRLFERHEGRVPTLPKVREHILITQFSTMTWSQYLALEAQMLARLERDDPVRFLLRCACSILEQDPDGLRIKASSALLEFLEFELFPEILACFRATLESPEDPDAYLAEMTSAPDIELPDTEPEREAVGRYIANQLHGKLLLIGPSLVARLLLVAGAVSTLLQQARVHGLQAAFALCEERFVAQSNDLEPLLLDFETALFETAVDRGLAWSPCP